MDISSNFPIDSIKTIGESIGIQSVPDDVAKEISEDITFKLKTLIQGACKIMQHSKRRKLNPSDFDNILKVKNVEPMYGSQSKSHIPFRFASGGGRELYFIEDKEMEISELVTLNTPRFPSQIAIKPHWLAIEGVQPSIPENPPAIAKDQQKAESVDPATKLSTQSEARDKRHIHGRGMKSTETVRVKQLATHELSAEQQLYYKEITEACVGSDEGKRSEALHSLTYDPGLYQMVPRLCTFIAEGVRVNVVQKNLALLIYLMRMAKALLDNQTLYLEKYLHDLIPSVMSCIVSKQLCRNPDGDNHWALRDFAAKQICTICKAYNTATNGIQTRVTRVFSKCLNTETTPLSAVYGALAGLVELGPEVCKLFIFPSIKDLGEKIEQCMEGPSPEKNNASHLKTILLKSLAPILKTIRNAPDIVQDYISEFGYLGTLLHSAVVKARQAPATPVSVNPPTPLKAVPQARIIQHGNFNMVHNAANVQGTPGTPRTAVVFPPSGTPSGPGMKVYKFPTRTQAIHQTSTTTGVVTGTGPMQKFVVVPASNQIPIKQEIKEEPMEVMSPPPSIDIM